jgi:molybdenum cofactor cytidylyltransferase
VKFGPVRLNDAEGAILAHAVRVEAAILKKGHVLTTGDLVLIGKAGIGSVTVARLEPGDVGEDEAARRLGEAISGGGVTAGPPATGRVNLYAAASGLLNLDRRAIDRVNAVTEEVTIAALPELAPIETGRMVATIKIIPFSVPAQALTRCVEVAGAARIGVHPFRPLAARLIQTINDGMKPSVIAKTSTVTTERVARWGGRLVGEAHCAHGIAALARAMAAQIAAGCDVLLVIGASAIVDRRDVIPAAILEAGGRIERLGMPVDPGNLILVAEIDGLPVLGLPGCARSPARNGLDWVLERISAGVPVGGGEIAAMGVGGLLIGGEEEKDYR